MEAIGFAAYMRRAGITKGAQNIMYAN